MWCRSNCTTPYSPAHGEAVLLAQEMRLRQDATGNAWRNAVHFLQPGPGFLPQLSAWLERLAAQFKLISEFIIVKSALFSITTLLGALSAPISASAADLVWENGLLMGAKDVVVAGQSWDVYFRSGTCIELFNGCVDSAVFAFQSRQAADTAGRALMQQVIVGAANDQPSLIYSCRFSTDTCAIWTPYIVYAIPGFPTSGLVDMSEVYNYPVPYNSSDHCCYGTRVSATYFAGHAGSPGTGFAVWHLATPVPEPTSGILLGLGLIGLLLRRHCAA